MHDFIFTEDKKAGVPPGAYAAKFAGYKETTTKKGAALLWQWTIVAGEHNGKTASRFTDPPGMIAPSPSNALGRLLAGLAGKPLTAGDSFDPNACVGKSYTIMIAGGPKGGGLCVQTVMPAM